MRAALLPLRLPLLLLLRPLLQLLPVLLLPPGALRRASEGSGMRRATLPRRAADGAVMRTTGVRFPGPLLLLL